MKKISFDFLKDVRPRRIERNSFMYGMFIGCIPVPALILDWNIIGILLSISLGVLSKYSFSKIERR